MNPPKIHSKTNNAGFALTATLSITSLALFTSLAMVSLSSITTKQASHGYHLSIAQANAKIALNDALAQLQFHLGPDKKVTVASTIYDGLAHDHGKTISQYTNSEIVHQNWMAALDSKDTIALEGGDAYYRRYCGNPRNARFNRWLVSGEGATLRDSASFELTSESVVMVGKGTIGGGGGGSDPRLVLVGLENITNGYATSKFGWWVGDNSLKATINHSRAELSSTPAQQVAHLSSGSNTDPSALTPFQYIDVTTLTDLQYLNRSLTHKTLELHSNTSLGDSVGAYFHDISLLSEGLLVNNATGELQSDISRLFSSDHLPSSFQTNKRKIQALTTIRNKVTRHTLYESLIGNIPSSSNGFKQTQANRPVTGWGLTPTWERLHDYHRYSKKVPTSSANKLLINASNMSALKELEAKPALPVITRLQWFISAAAGKDNRLAYVVEPVVTFWNPHNIEIEFDSNDCQFALSSFWPSLTMKGKQNGVVMSPFANNGNGYDKDLQLRNSFSPIYSQDTAQYFQFDGIKLQPGETKVYSDSSTALNSWNDQWANWKSIHDPFGSGSNYYGNTNPLTAAPGWSVSGGHMGDGRHQGSSNYNGTIEPNKILSVEIRPSKAWNQNWLGGYSGNMSMLNQLDLLKKTATGRVDYMNSIQSFVAHNQSEQDMRELWGLAPGQSQLERTGISTNALLAGQKIPLCVIDTAVRTELDGDYQGLPYLHASPVHGSILSNSKSNREKATSYWTSSLKLVTSLSSHTVEIDANDRGFFGPGNTAATGYNFYTAQEIPQQTPLNHAAYRNFDLLYSPHVLKNSWRSESYNVNKQAISSSPSWYSVGPGIQKIIGNSYASPAIPRGLYMVKEGNTHFIDHSMIANATLYGAYFHSGISAEYLGGTAALNSRLEQVLDGYSKGPLAHLVPAPLTTANQATTEILNNNNGYKATAKHFRIGGAFNVNSTSIEAWRALLRGLRGEKVPFTTTNNTALTDSNVGATPFPNMMKPNAQGVDPASTESQEKWTGYLRISDDEINTLAENLVEQVKKRGPFLNLSEFINRYPTNTTYNNKAQLYVPQAERSDLSLCGAIQTAIDEAGINDSLFPLKNTASDVYDAAYHYPEAAQIARAAGSPTYLSQGDVLQAIGNRLTTRGDTFTIRAYGDSRNADGNIMAKVYLEALVQRNIEYVDPTDTPETAFDDLTSDINKTYGRKFHVINLKWLDEKEI